MGENPTTQALQAAGASIFIGHAAGQLPKDADQVIYSEAISKSENPEYLAAQEKGLTCLSYFQALGQLSEEKKTIVVTGTHGKTTTTAMLGQALAEAGEDPTVIVGSRVPAFGGKNIRIGQSGTLVAEGCEYRRSFLSFRPFGVIMLNCELEHVDYYKSEEDYIAAFKELIAKIPEGGFLVYNAEDENCRKAAAGFAGHKVPIGQAECEGISLRVPGKFNVLNAAHARAAALQLTQNKEAVTQGLHEFIGTARRMETKGEKNGIRVIDDYGHHPTEVKATLSALRHKYPDGHLICVFQPHQYSRTHQLIGDFKEAFHDADLIIIPNIFEARDSAEDKEKISAESLAAQIPNAIHGENFEKTLKILEEQAKTGDTIITMGAGNVHIVGENFLR